MNRRRSIKALALSTVVPGVLLDKAPIGVDQEKLAERIPKPEIDASFISSWHEWPDMDWAGPEYWGDHQPLPGQPRYTGNFLDGFGNRMTVHTVANPHQTGGDLRPGYGMVIFDKVNRTIRMECWPRFIDPRKHPNGQYQGWPLTVEQQANYGRPAAAWLPEIKVDGLQNPVIEIIDERSGELVYCLRIKGNQFKPKVFAPGRYTIRLSDPDTSLVIERKNVQAQKKTNRTLTFKA
jgi:hypothetical protein